MLFRLNRYNWKQYILYESYCKLLYLRWRNLWLWRYTNNIEHPKRFLYKWKVQLFVKQRTWNQIFYRHKLPWVVGHVVKEYFDCRGRVHRDHSLEQLPPSRRDATKEVVELLFQSMVSENHLFNSPRLTMCKLGRCAITLRRCKEVRIFFCCFSPHYLSDTTSENSLTLSAVIIL